MGSDSKEFILREVQVKEGEVNVRWGASDERLPIIHVVIWRGVREIELVREGGVVLFLYVWGRLLRRGRYFGAAVSNFPKERPCFKRRGGEGIKKGASRA